MTTNKIDRERASIANFIEQNMRLLREANALHPKVIPVPAMIETMRMIAAAIRTGEYAAIAAYASTHRVVLGQRNDH